MDNLISDSRQKDFYVFVDPQHFLVRHHITLGLGFVSVPENESNETLMFIPNPKFKGFISPFQNRLLLRYRVDYNLEIARREYFKEYPSRLHAISLLDSEEQAENYKSNNPQHVRDRQLKKIRTNGQYIYIQFMIQAGWTSSGCRG